MKGVILVNKEANMTSRDVINKLNHIFHMKKMGHTGTLDPMATGVLVVTIGSYTKLGEDLTSLDKEYIATVKLGYTTDTLDTTGKILSTKEFNLTEELVKNTVESFLGKSMQKVPIYSAVKIKGKKLYEYAREGIDVKLPDREINVSYIELLEYNEDEFTFKVCVSKGTYIRSLIDDICKKMNTLGVMGNLVRTKQGRFKIEDTYTLQDIIDGNYKLLNATELFDYQNISLTEELYFKIKNGAKINCDVIDGNYNMIYNGELVAIYTFKNKEGKIRHML